MQKRGYGECGYPSSLPKYPTMPYPPASPRAPYEETRPRGLGPLFNHICQCDHMGPTSPTEKLKNMKTGITPQQNELDPSSQTTQEGPSKMFYWVINDPENTDPRVQDIVCIDSSAENRPLKLTEIPKKTERGTHWKYEPDEKSDPKEKDESEPHKSVKNRKQTGTASQLYKIKKHLMKKIKEINARESSDENIRSFDFPEEIREPQLGDLICWMGKSKDGPLTGVRAIWEAEEMTGEPGKICWLGREVTDGETNSALRYGNRSKSGKHNWKSRTGFCLPPISSFKQNPIDLIQRLNTLKPDVPTKNANSTTQNENNHLDEDKLILSISAYNIPSGLLKTISWQDFNVTRTKVVK